MTDEQYDGLLVTMDGMRRQLEIAAKSGIEYQIQVAEHHKKSYYTIKVCEAESSARDFYHATICKPRGRRRLIKMDGSEVKVIFENNGMKVGE
jgi:hypothetical protein